jgi:vacuolar-type H+-ATPase subunit H
MPDQSSASTEHAIMQEVTAPLQTLPDDPVPVASDVDFPIVLRGYDRIAVDAYVKKTSQLVAELQATRSPEAAVRRALSRVGEEVSGILQRAHETAAQITTQSRSEAEDRLVAARREAGEITREAEDRVKELDLETDRIWEERLRIVEDARELARQLLTLADSAAQRFPAEETASTEAVIQPDIAEIFSVPAEESVGEVVGEELGGEVVGEQVGGEVVGEQVGGELAGEQHAGEVVDEQPAGEVFPERSGEDAPESFDREATVIMPPINPHPEDETTQ